eukprot:5399493-Prymnesium_polylepis.2
MLGKTAKRPAAARQPEGGPGLRRLDALGEGGQHGKMRGDTAAREFQGLVIEGSGRCTPREGDRVQHRHGGCELEALQAA